jgi:phenylacetate-CoA ligase
MGRLYRTLCRNVVLPLADAATGRSVARKLRFLEEAQWWTPEELQAYQDRMVGTVVRHAYDHTAYYRRILGEAGLRPEGFATTADLVRLPLINKRVIRETGFDNLLAEPKQRLIACSTSGSSGEQGTVYLSREAKSLTYAAVLLFFGWAGFALGDRHVLTGMTLRRGFQKSVKDLLFRCHYVRAFDLSDPAIAKICLLLEAREMKTLIGYASSLYCIASYCVRQGRPLHLHTVVSLGDMLYPHYRETIESAFGCRVHDTYGCGEGFQVAAQCSAMRYHVCMPLTFVEILDDAGIRVPPGEVGRVVLTRLDLNPMPLIRYEVGDLAALSPGRECPCGRNLLLLDRIYGRDTDIVVTPHGQRLIVHFFTALFQRESRIRQFQVVQDTPDAITIKVVPGEGFCREVTEALRQSIRAKCNEDVEVGFDVVDEIPPSPSGKQRFIVSHVRTGEQRSEMGATGAQQPVSLGKHT